MALFLLVILLAVSFLGLVFRKNNIAMLMSGLSLLLFFANGTGLLPRLLLAELQTASRQSAPTFERSNTIVLLGGGKEAWPDTSFSTQSFAMARVVEAARLYFSCKTQNQQCRILASGGDPTHSGIAEATIMARELSELGVALTDIQTETQSNNTYQNAKFSAALLANNPAERIYLVSSGLHLSRALILFSHFGTQPIPAPADHFSAKTSLLVTSRNFLLMDLALHEFVGILQFYVYNLLGLNS